jgi:hypothetical protein
VCTEYDRWDSELQSSNHSPDHRREKRKDLGERKGEGERS